MFALGWRSQCFYILVFQHQVNAWMCWGCPSTNGTMEMLRWGLVAVCHHCRWREFSCYRPSPKLRCASKLNAGHWWSLVFDMFCIGLPISQQNMDGPTKIPSRLEMACRWRSPSIWGVQTAVLVWPHAWRFLVGPWDLCHYRWRISMQDDAGLGESVWHCVLRCFKQITYALPWDSDTDTVSLDSFDLRILSHIKTQDTSRL